MAGIHIPFVPISFLNTQGYAYITGDANTDGSLRVVIGSDQENQKFEQRANGEWNPTSVEVDSSTLILGMQLQVEAFANFIKTTATDYGTESIIPKQHYTDEGSSFPHTHRFYKKIIKFIDQEVDSQEIVGTTLNTEAIVGSNVVADNLYLRTGSVVPTETVVLTINSDAPGNPVIWQRNLSPDIFIADTEIEIPLVSSLQADDLSTIFFELSSETPLSVKGNALGLWWLAFDYRDFVREQLLVNNLCFSRLGGFTLSRDLRLTVGRVRLHYSGVHP